MDKSIGRNEWMVNHFYETELDKQIRKAHDIDDPTYDKYLVLVIPEDKKKELLKRKKGEYEAFLKENNIKP